MCGMRGDDVTNHNGICRVCNAAGLCRHMLPYACSVNMAAYVLA